MAVRAQPRRSGYAGVACPQCERPLRHEKLASGPQTCPYCREMFEAEVFRPPEREVRVAAVETLGPAGGVACAVHARNAAVASCERCGHFMCTLCRIDADGRTLCPACFDRLSAEGALASTLTRFRDYAGSARGAAVVGLLMWIFAGVIGPVAVYYAVKALQQKKAMGEAAGRVGLVIVLALGVLESLGGIVLLLAMFGVFK